MRTCCLIKINNGDESITMVELKNGYPSYMVEEVFDMILPNIEWTPNDISSLLVKYNCIHTKCASGEEKFLYVIDCPTRRLKCYHRDNKEGFDMSFSLINKMY